MCIRDRVSAGDIFLFFGRYRNATLTEEKICYSDKREFHACLLYTSDAADERSSVDLGGRRIIKKKQKMNRDGGVCPSKK